MKCVFFFKSVRSISCKSIKSGRDYSYCKEKQRTETKRNRTYWPHLCAQHHVVLILCRTQKKNSEIVEDIAVLVCKAYRHTLPLLGQTVKGTEIMRSWWDKKGLAVWGEHLSAHKGKNKRHQTVFDPWRFRTSIKCKYLDNGESQHYRLGSVCWMPKWPFAEYPSFPPHDLSFKQTPRASKSRYCSPHAWQFRHKIWLQRKLSGLWTWLEVCFCSIGQS